MPAVCLKNKRGLEIVWTLWKHKDDIDIEIGVITEINYRRT